MTPARTLPAAITAAIDRLEDTGAARAIAASNSLYPAAIVRPNQEARAALERAIAALLPPVSA